MSDEDSKGVITERWECTDCGSPCRIEIVYTNSKMTSHLDGQDRFVNKRCPCNESPCPNWTRIE